MSYWSHRTVCGVLEDMRSCYTSYNFAPIKGLIEELQVLGNRMEAALGEKKDLPRISEELSDLKKERKALLKEVEALRKLTGKERKKNDE